MMSSLPRVLPSTSPTTPLPVPDSQVSSTTKKIVGFAAFSSSSENAESAASVLSEKHKRKSRLSTELAEKICNSLSSSPSTAIQGSFSVSAFGKKEENEKNWEHFLKQMESELSYDKVDSFVEVESNYLLPLKPYFLASKGNYNDFLEMVIKSFSDPEGPYSQKLTDNQREFAVDALSVSRLQQFSWESFLALSKISPADKPLFLVLCHLKYSFDIGFRMAPIEPALKFFFLHQVAAN